MNKYFEEVKKMINPAYMVGGSVRDEILGIEPHDYDFTTSLNPDQIEQAIRNEGKHPFLVGKKFGTIGVKVDGAMVEITTFRSEEYEKDNRKPKVTFVKDITADLMRRDFTINAMAKRGDKIIDPFGGQEDLKNKVIRAVGKPSARFKEDPLRMLRAIRFAAQFNFNIEEETFESIVKNASKILTVSRERWMIELNKILLTKDEFGLRHGLNYLGMSRLLNFMMPELSLQVGFDQKSEYHDFTLWEHTIEVVCATPPELNMRWAALLHDIAKPFVMTPNKKGYNNYIHHEELGAEIVKKMARYLNWDNDKKDAVYNLVKDHLKDDCPLRIYDNKAKKGKNEKAK